MSWLTRLYNIPWRSGTVSLDWATGVVVLILKNGDWSVCSNYRGITLLSLPGKVYARVLERKIQPMVEPPTIDPGGTMWNSSRPWDTEPALYLHLGARESMGSLGLEVIC